jgi:hypothetical protein
MARAGVVEGHLGNGVGGAHLGGREGGGVDETHLGGQGRPECTSCGNGNGLV